MATNRSNHQPTPLGSNPVRILMRSAVLGLLLSVRTSLAIDLGLDASQADLGLSLGNEIDINQLA